MRALVVVSFSLAACYSPQLERCTVRCSAGDTCPLDMTCSSDHHCHDRGDATACPVDQFTLTVKPAGTGMGLVTGMPAINCGTACSEKVDYGTSVDLAATAASGSRFVGWGGACSGAAGCTVKVVADQTVDANFALQERLTVELTGAGAGDVASIAPPDLGFDCPTGSAPCTVDIDMGTVVTLMATADMASASMFTGWGGACASASGTTCTLTMDMAQTASADFQ